MILDLIDSGVIGKVTSLSANLGYPITHVERMTNPDLCGGALLDLGVYPINFACMAFPEKIKEVSSACVKWETGVDAQNSITLTFEDGRMAVLYSSMMVQSDRLGVINGDKGYIEVQNINNPEEIRIFDLSRAVSARFRCRSRSTGMSMKFWRAKRRWRRAGRSVRRCRMQRRSGSWN